MDDNQKNNSDFSNKNNTSYVDDSVPRPSKETKKSGSDYSLFILFYFFFVFILVFLAWNYYPFSQNRQNTNINVNESEEEIDSQNIDISVKENEEKTDIVEIGNRVENDDYITLKFNKDKDINNLYSPDPKSPFQESFDLALSLKYEKDNLSINYPETWTKKSEAIVVNYLKNPNEMKYEYLVREDAGCYLFFGETSSGAISGGGFSAAEVSYPHGIEAFGSRGYIHQIIYSRANSEPEFDNRYYSKYKTIVVTRFPSRTSTSGFVLTTKDGSPLAGVCLKEFEEMLNSTERIESLTKVTAEMEGKLFIETSDNKFLVFIDKKTQETARLSDNRFNSLVPTTLHDNKLFFVDETKKKVKVFDPFSGETNTLALLYDDKKPIHSFYIRDNVMFYLFGESCMRSNEQCKDMTLASYDLVSGRNKILTVLSTSRKIKGLSEDRNTVFLEWDYGDSTCIGGSYESFTLSNNQFLKLADYGYCFNSNNTKTNPLGNTYIYKNEQIRSLEVANGKITVSASGDDFVAVGARMGEYLSYDPEEYYKYSERLKSKL